MKALTALTRLWYRGPQPTSRVSNSGNEDLLRCLPSRVAIYPGNDRILGSKDALRNDGPAYLVILLLRNWVNALFAFSRL